ncbi:putative protein OS=Streptomyces fumanus OX=67302 GN=GCM10018772_62460 PE=4 SV=1 [Streptomyces fumanus]|uniref:Uncharacterized protein n=1 Tax=Streptomyces fumanus TaxID=67302 RepID=A0A919E8D0_9ACTN|nr:hypothetical protein GCM10018772_62460 [Streptomyces fumanus]
MTVTPPARAIVHSPFRSAWAARCRPTSEDEQAVSTVTAGPSKPKAYDSRPEAALPVLPISRYPSTPSGTFCIPEA